MMKKVTLLFMITVFCSQTIWAQNVNTLQQLANNGNMEAMYLLGLHYLNGQQVIQNNAIAFNLFYKAAGLGHADAENQLAICYSQGKGTKKNMQKAFYHFTEAAAKRSVNAQYQLGLCFYYGQGIKKDYSQAFYYFNKAAEAGNPEAQTKLGECYKYGHGTKKNYNRALTNFIKAAQQRYVPAEFNIGLLYYSGQGVPQDSAKAVEWFSLSATENETRTGYPIAQYFLGLCYKDGFGVQKNYNKSTDLFYHAATKGFPPAQYELGFAYEEGLGIKEDLTRAFFWYTQSTKQGNSVIELEKYIRFSTFLNFFLEKKVLELRVKHDKEPLDKYAERMKLLATDSIVIPQLTPLARKNFIQMHQRIFVMDSLNYSYDNENKVMVVSSPKTGEYKIRLNTDEALEWRQKWPKIIPKPVFEIKNDTFAIENMTLFLPETNQLLSAIATTKEEKEEQEQKPEQEDDTEWISFDLLKKELDSLTK